MLKLGVLILVPQASAIIVMFRLPQAFLPCLPQLQSHPCPALSGRLSLGRTLAVAWFTVTIWERFRLTQAQVLPSPLVTVVQRLQQHTLRLVVCMVCRLKLVARRLAMLAIRLLACRACTPCKHRDTRRSQAACHHKDIHPSKLRHQRQWLRHLQQQHRGSLAL